MRRRNVTLFASLWLVGLVGVVSAQDQVMFNDLVHKSLGNSTLNVDGSLLTVGNLADDGSGGVSISVENPALGNAVEFIWAIELPDGMPVGAQFVTDYYGDHPTRGNIRIGSSTMTVVDAGGEVNPDYGGSSYTLQLIRDGGVVYEEAGKTGVACVVAGSRKCKVCWFGTGICSYHFGFTDATEIHDVMVAGGPTVAADMIKIIPDPDSFEGVTSITTCEARAAHISSIIIGEEVVVSVPAGVDYGSAPGELSALSVAPNPARHSVTAMLSLPSSGPVHMQLSDIKGNIVRASALGTLNAGAQSVVVPLVDASGARLPSGVYVLRLVAGTYTAASKIMVTE